MEQNGTQQHSSAPMQNTRVFSKEIQRKQYLNISTNEDQHREILGIPFAVYQSFKLARITPRRLLMQ